MFDRSIQKYNHKNLKYLAKYLKCIGITANFVTTLALFSSIICFIFICFGYLYCAVFLILFNRLLDGLDGELARLTEENKFGSFFDITSDFTFYSLVPLGFALYLPLENAIPTLFLLVSFCLNSSSFLARAIIVEKYNLNEDKREKGFFYSFGIIEGFETTVFFLLFCLLPNYYATLAYLFSFLTLLTHLLRIFSTKKQLN